MKRGTSTAALWQRGRRAFVRGARYFNRFSIHLFIPVVRPSERSQESGVRNQRSHSQARLFFHRRQRCLEQLDVRSGITHHIELRTTYRVGTHLVSLNGLVVRLTHPGSERPYPSMLAWFICHQTGRVLPMANRPRHRPYHDTASPGGSRSPSPTSLYGSIYIYILCDIRPSIV